MNAIGKQITHSLIWKRKMADQNHHIPHVLQHFLNNK